MPYTDRLERGFAWYLLEVARAELNSVATGSTYDAVAIDQVASVRCTVPILSEQRAIAAFLDREIAKIDALMAKKEQLIELLQERRTALISQVVTKGLDPAVPKKDSGVEWLGEIPACWQIKRLKFCLRSIEQGWSPSCENRQAELDEWGVLKVGCVNGMHFDPQEQKALPTGTEPRPELEIISGDILMSRANTRELLGSVAIVDHVRPRLLLCDKLYRLQVVPTTVDPSYLVTALNASAARFQMERDATGAIAFQIMFEKNRPLCERDGGPEIRILYLNIYSSSMQNIGQDTVLNLVIPLPPISETTCDA